MQIFSIYSNFLLIFEVFSADLFFFSNPIINLTYLCIFRGPGNTNIQDFIQYDQVLFLASESAFSIIPSISILDIK